MLEALNCLLFPLLFPSRHLIITAQWQWFWKRLAFNFVYRAHEATGNILMNSFPAFLPHPGSLVTFDGAHSIEGSHNLLVFHSNFV